MPTYKYRCQQCGHVFEGQAKMSDPNPPCPANVNDKPCASKVEKDFDWGCAPAVQFRGGGWAKDGYS